MKLLILTQYFPPETGAPQNRLYELAVRLKARGVHVEVLTAMPNYPKMVVFEEYRGKKYVREEMDGLIIHRTRIYASQSKGIIKRLLNYFSFVHTSWNRGRKLGHFDFILCESPPLFLGYTAMSLSKKLKAKMIFNVADLWPESAEKLEIVTNKFFLKQAYKLEAKCYRKAAIVTVQTQGFVRNIRSRHPGTNLFWLPNGVDLNNYDPAKSGGAHFREKYGIAPDDIVLFYGGILGHAQGLDIIIEAANRFKEKQKLKWILMGSGPLKNDLQALAAKYELQNLIFADPVERHQMRDILKETDASIIPLKKLDLFQVTIPSKIFEVLAMEKPILLGVEGEAKERFIDEANGGLAFEPENLDALCAAVQELIDHPEKMIEMGKNGRLYVDQNFNRDTIVGHFYDFLIDHNK